MINLEALPRLELISSLTNIPNLREFDAENNLLSEINFDYYTSHEFQSSQTVRDSISENCFSAIHCNIRSLAANHDNLTTLLSNLKHNFHIIGLSETKIVFNKDCVANISIPGYQFFSQPSVHNAGGVGFYIRNEIEFHLRDDLSSTTDDYECLWIEVHSKSHNIVCAVVYRHPHSNLDNFTDYFTAAVDKISKESKFSILMGDFNLNLLNFESHTPTDLFINTLATYCFQPHIIKPTRITDHSATLIDHIYFNSVEHATVSGNLVCDISDHLPNFLIINKLSCISSKPTIYQRDYSRLDQEDLLAEVQSINWEEVLPAQVDINIIFDSFHTKLTELIDKHVPLKKVSKRQLRLQSKPWITKGIRSSIAIRNKLYKSYMSTSNDYYFTKYKIYRNKLKHLILISKKSFYNNYFNTNKDNIKETWKGIKQLITLKKTAYSTPTTLKIGNTKITDTKSIANEFNKYFANVGSNLANAIPVVNTSFEEFLRLCKSPCSSFVLFPVTTHEIEDEISNLNPSKSTGPYSLPTKILKILKSLLSGPLTCLFNCSFSTGVVPSKLKVARVIPVHKNGPRAVISNYRPISLLSVFNKILEKLMYNRLITFLEKNQVLFNGQFGFRSNHSTLHAILLIADKIQKAIERNQYSCGIFLDLSKAFDTVNHTILIKKLEYYGIRGIAKDWFCSYLSNRKQLVSIGNVTSDLKPITCGVPQGSVLGPLLFLLYINDFSKSAPDLDFHLFADDSNLFCSHKSLQCLEAKVNVELNNVNNWLCVNKLSLNIDKSNFVIFHPSQKKVQYPINLIINNKILEEKKYVKCLGIIMDCNLNWKQHIHELSKKVSRSIGILSKLRHYVPQSILIQIYYSIVFPFLIYGVLIWGNTYKSNIYPLVILQKKAIRIITFSHFQSHTSPLFKKFNLLKLPDIVYLYTAVFMHQFHKGNLPEKFNNYFTLVSNQHSYNTRLASKATFILPLVRTNYGLFNIRFCGPKVWNSIEESLKSLSKFSFKKKLKQQLILAY